MRVTPQRTPSQVVPALARFVVMYVTLGLLIETLTFDFVVEQVPVEPVVHVRVVVVPPLTAKVTVTPATGWSRSDRRRLTSTQEVHFEKPICPWPLRLVMCVTTDACWVGVAEVSLERGPSFTEFTALTL